MHSEIAIVRRRFIGLYEQQREYLRGQSDVALRELARESEALLNSPELPTARWPTRDWFATGESTGTISPTPNQMSLRRLRSFAGQRREFNHERHETMKKNTECGTILPKKSMILRRFVGEAANGALKYEMSTSMSGNPIIRSRKTGKWFSLSWADILNLAETAGIND